MFGNRYGKVKNTKQEAEKPFWISFADLMTALMTLFLVVMSVSLMVVTKKVNQATFAENQRKADIEAICASIKKTAEALDTTIHVDCADNRINFGEAGRFSYNDYRLNTTGMQALQKVVPVILKAADSDEGKKWFKQVVIEGFTDTDGSYLYNLHLSLQRSEWVMCALLDDRQAKLIGLNDTQKQMVRQLFLAGGVSFNAAKESKEASRRIELRLQFYGLADANNKPPPLNFAINKPEMCQL